MSPFPNNTGNRRFWTRERVLAGLALAKKEIKGPLPCSDDTYLVLKKGRLDWPTAAAIYQEFGSLARAWLAAGAGSQRVDLKNNDWTLKEEAYLLEHAGEKTIGEIAQHLRRSPGSVRSRLNKNLKTTARANQGLYSAAELAKEFGCPYQRVRNALREGKITGTYDPLRNRWQVDYDDLTPGALAILQAPKTHSYKNSPTDLGDYEKRHGLKRKIVGGKVIRVAVKA